MVAICECGHARAFHFVPSLLERLRGESARCQAQDGRQFGGYVVMVPCRCARFIARPEPRVPDTLAEMMRESES